MAAPTDLLAKLEQGLSSITTAWKKDSSHPLHQQHAVWPMMEKFILLVSSISHNGWKKLRAQHPELLTHRPLISRLYAQYISHQENLSVEQLLQGGTSTADLEAGELGSWGKKAYDRVADLFEFADFSQCQRLVMVGCGPLPVTLIHIFHRTDIAELIAVDIDPQVIEGVKSLAQRFHWDRIIPLCSNGNNFDYGSADIVYLANLLSPKSTILEEVTDRVRPGTQIILRDPAGSGEMFAEVGIPYDSKTLTIEVEGPSDSNFLSRDIFLRKR